MFHILCVPKIMECVADPGRKWKREVKMSRAKNFFTFARFHFFTFLCVPGLRLVFKDLSVNCSTHSAIVLCVPGRKSKRVKGKKVKSEKGKKWKCEKAFWPVRQQYLFHFFPFTHFHILGVSRGRGLTAKRFVRGVKTTPEHAVPIPGRSAPL